MIDLHCHSTASDGSFTPTELVKEAERIGLKALALTDHDTINGLAEFNAAGKDSPVEAVPGIELAACDAENHNLSFHIVGLFLTTDSPRLNTLLADVIRWRNERNIAMVEKLASLGIPITLTRVQEVAGGAVIGRPHIAQVLIENGFANDTQNAFDRWLSSGKPGYVYRRVPTPSEAIAAIHSAGGTAVWAHPYTRGNYTNLQMRRIASSLKDMGLDGMEAYYPMHTLCQVRNSLDICKGVGLAPSGGSDFHGTRLRNIALGTGTGKLCVPDSLLDALRPPTRQAASTGK
jgi:3',5'-nucleoside bisphosphate phosphatase